MGSYCSLSFDEVSIVSAKSMVPDELVALFQESDRAVVDVPETEEEEARSDVVYRATRAVILKRLDLLGFTPDLVRERFEQWRRDQIESWKEYYADHEVDAEKVTLTAIEALTIDAWRRRASVLLKSQWELSDQQPADETDARMRDHDGGWLHFDGYGSLATLRAILEALPETEQVTLDISDLVDGGWISSDEPLCSSRREVDRGEIRALAPTVIIAEGSTDIDVMRASLASLYPEVEDYYSFFDHRELNVDGGAPYVLKFLKAFAAARTTIRIIAIFDNDVVGVQTCAQVIAMSLPKNISAMTLPNISLAESYPTVGPQGDGVANINGRAASIELYLGRACLVDEGGNLRPVRWTGYQATAKAYQGEVEGKAEIRKAFFSKIKSVASSQAARDAYPEISLVWQSIFNETTRTMNEARRQESRDMWREF